MVEGRGDWENGWNVSLHVQREHFLISTYRHKVRVSSIKGTVDSMTQVT